MTNHFFKMKLMYLLWAYLLTYINDNNSFKMSLLIDCSPDLKLELHSSFEPYFIEIIY